MRAQEFVAERKKKKKSARKSGGYFFPGYGYYGVGDSGEGGGDGGGESVDPRLTEIEKIDQYYYKGGKKDLSTFGTPKKNRLQPLPGGTDLLYSIIPDSYGPRVSIVDPGMPGITKPSIVANLSLVNGVVPNSVQVAAITVDEDYRGRGLAKALYGIVLTIMKKILISGSTQTPGGRRNWMSLANIPGVEIKGLLELDNFELEQSNNKRIDANSDKKIDQLMQLGGQFVAKGRIDTYWAFDVVPGNGQLKPAVKNKLSQLYGVDSTNLLMATYAGGQQAVTEGAVEDLEKDLDDPKGYSAIDHMMQTIARDHGITGRQLHDKFVAKHGVIPDKWTRDQLRELSFLGSECTKDCSGHRAGYDWSKRKGLRQANSWSPSFNKGAGLAVAGK